MHEVETERLLLRMFTSEDLDTLARIFADPDVMEYLGKDGSPISREQTEEALDSIIRHWEKYGYGRWAVVYKESGVLIGYAGIRSLADQPELVYLLAKEYWGQGLATEVAQACLRYGFEEKHFDSILAMARPLNVKSRHVMEKVGMRYEKEAVFYDVEVVLYSISRGKYRTNKQNYHLREIGRSTHGQ